MEEVGEVEEEAEVGGDILGKLMVMYTKLLLSDQMVGNAEPL